MFSTATDRNSNVERKKASQPAIGTLNGFSRENLRQLLSDPTDRYCIKEANRTERQNTSNGQMSTAMLRYLLSVTRQRALRSDTFPSIG
jgi:hypothetical protein